MVGCDPRKAHLRNVYDFHRILLCSKAFPYKAPFVALAPPMLETSLLFHNSRLDPHIYGLATSDGVETFFSETETLAKTEVSKQETSQDISDLVETRRDETET